MPRFYFHTEDGVCYPDEDGTDLPDIEHAKSEALKFLCERLHDNPHEFWQHGNWRVIVSDAEDMTLFILDLSLVLAAAMPRSALPLPR